MEVFSTVYGFMTLPDALGANIQIALCAKALNYTALLLEMQAFFAPARTRAWMQKSENQLLPKIFRQKLIDMGFKWKFSRRFLKGSAFSD